MNKQTGNLWVVAAASGTGKTSLVNALVEQVDDIGISVSTTTRPPRPGDVDGQHYHFVDEAAFDAQVAAGEFLEHATVFGYQYGTSKTWVETELNAGRDVILEIDWQGAAQMRAHMPTLLSIFIVPPSLETLQERLKRRAQDGEHVIADRMAAAVSEMSHHSEFDYLVVNEDFDTALADLAHIVMAARLKTDKQSVRHNELLQGLKQS